MINNPVLTPYKILFDPVNSDPRNVPKACGSSSSAFEI